MGRIDEDRWRPHGCSRVWHSVIDMGLWIPAPQLESGEHLLLKPGANRSQGNRAIGGRLFVTDRRVVFVPNAFDRLTGARTWSCSHAEIESVGTAARTLQPPLSGGARRRLELRLGNNRICLDDNRREWFVVNHVESVVEALRKALSYPQPDRRPEDDKEGTMEK